MSPTECAIDEFLSKVEAAGESALLLDYDGTLAPLVEDRYTAAPYPDVVPLLRSLMKCSRTRLVIVSGRPVSEVLTLLHLPVSPEVWGCHGLERLQVDGSLSTGKLDKRSEQCIDEALQWAREQELERRIERKSGGIALHWRGMDPRSVQHISELALSALTPLTRESRLCLHEFDGGLELRLRSCNKGHVVDQILRETDGAPVAYLGDDSTDEDAFRALQGNGLSVLVRPEFRSTAADIWLRPPEELVGFLMMWLAACGGAE